MHHISVDNAQVEVQVDKQISQIEIKKVEKIQLPPTFINSADQERFDNKLKQIFGSVESFLIEEEVSGEGPKAILYKFGLKEEKILFENLPQTKEGFEKLIREVEKAISYSEHSRDLGKQLTNPTNKQRENLINMEKYIKLNLNLRNFLLDEQRRLGLSDKLTRTQGLNQYINATLPSMRKETPIIGTPNNSNQGIIV